MAFLRWSNSLIECIWFCTRALIILTVFFSNPSEATISMALIFESMLSRSVIISSDGLCRCCWLSMNVRICVDIWIDVRVCVYDNAIFKWVFLVCCIIIHHALLERYVCAVSTTVWNPQTHLIIIITPYDQYVSLRRLYSTQDSKSEMLTNLTKKIDFQRYNCRYNVPKMTWWVHHSTLLGEPWRTRHSQRGALWYPCHLFAINAACRLRVPFQVLSSLHDCSCNVLDRLHVKYHKILWSVCICWWHQTWQFQVLDDQIEMISTVSLFLLPSYLFFRVWMFRYNPNISKFQMISSSRCIQDKLVKPPSSYHVLSLW